MSKIPQREIILAKAGELFHQRGFGAVPLDDIFQACGVHRSVFYQHFSTKAALGKAWLDRLRRRMTVFNQDFLSRPCERERRLRKYFYAMRDWVETNQFRSCQFSNTAACIGADTDGELALIIDQYKRDQRQFFIDMAKLLVDEEDARQVGTTIFLLYSGAMTECQNLKALWPLDDALAQAERLCGVRRNA